MGKFIKILNENYEFWKQEECPPESKLEYLGAIVFDFVTYCGEIDEFLAKSMMPVLKCIVNRTAFDYIKDDGQHINYIAMCNMPFLKNKLEWGTSIRGAWLDKTKSYEIDCGRIKIEKGEIEEFVKDIIVWEGMK